MMEFVIGYYVLQIVAIIVFILLGYFIYDKRVNRNHGDKVPNGFERTEEVNIDPLTNEKTRIYYNTETGERFYKKGK